MEIYRGSWHGKNRYFGIHYDLHAGEKDTELGLRATPEELIPMLKLMGVEFVQTDCKGHPGYTSWFSKTPDASVPSQLKADAMAGWREATRRLGLPLHCHYSGIWDKAAGAKHPEWAVVGKDGKPVGAPFGENAGKPTGEKMCPRSGYLETLLIPQMIELIDRYGVDGFWVDGDIWAVEPCYCDRCRAEFTRRTGIAEPAKDAAEANWTAWINFTLESYYEYVTRYCNAVHAHKKGVLVCSNWLQTFTNPGAPVVPTDWISGDNAWIWGMDASRCEARFISTRGKHWDIMLWAFYRSHGMNDPTSPWVFKPAQMLQQEAAVTLALGGSLQIYEHPSPLRDGRLVPWRMKLLGQVGRFAKARRALCQDTQTVPQAAVLHSEHHANKHRGTNLMWGVDVAPVRGATYSLLENHYGTDILDEWALVPRLSEFPLVVAPERNDMSPRMLDALRAYVNDGGRLLVTGADAFDRFGGEFLGVTSAEVREKATFHVPADGGSVAVYSEKWRLVAPAGAKAFGQLATTSLLDDRLLPHPAYTINKVGRGAVAYAPFDLFRYYERERYPRVLAIVGEMAANLAGKLPIRVSGPVCVDVVLRRKGPRTLVHLINRASGIPNTPNNGAIDEIPQVGPVTLEMDLAQRPRKVSLAFEEAPLKWKYVAGKKTGKLTATLERIHIHAAIVVESK